MSLVHLHCHTAHSLVNGRDGLCRPEDLVKRAKKFGQPAIACTDHGVMSAAPEFYRAAQAEGIQPIIGVEGYIVPDAKAIGFGPNGNLRDRRNFHITLHALNEQGYKDLVRLSTWSHTEETFYYRPRMDHAMLRTVDTSNLVCLSGCVMAELPQTLLQAIKHIVADEVPTPQEQQRAERRGYTVDKGWAWPRWSSKREAALRAHPDFKQAMEAALLVLKSYRSMFPEGHYFYEVMDHGYALEEWAQRLLIPEARRYGVPVVVTNDAHVPSAKDSDLGEIMRLSQWNDTLCGRPDPKHLEVCSHKTLAKRLDHLLPGKDFIEAAENTLRVADMASGLHLSAFETKRYRIPKFKDDKGHNEDFAVTRILEWCEPRLERLCALYPERADEYRARLQRELSVLKKFRYLHMFLITADYVNWAKREGIPVGAGRGSAAGSLIAYCMRITEIDPIRHGLLFERFLDPDRASMPDFDVDFASSDIDRVFGYLADKYGADNVARICAFDRLRPKSIVQKLGKTLGSLTHAQAITLTKDLEDDNTRRDLDYMKQWWDEQAENEALTAMRDHAKETFDYDIAALSERMFQLPVSVSAHAAAVVIGDEKNRVQDWVPMQYVPSSKRIVTQYDMDQIEALGFVKFDILSVGTLDTLGDTIKQIGYDPFEREVQERGALSYEDPKTYELISKIHTDGLFQLSGGTAKQVIRQIGGCHSFEDIVAVMSLGRPGAVRFAGKYRVNREMNWADVQLAHPDLKDLLRGSYGVVLFQEDVMAITKHIGMSVDGRNKIMHAVKKKDMAEFAEVELEFLECATENCGWTLEQAQDVYDQIKDYAGYGFNKSHAVSYADLAFKTAFLKAHWPGYFIAAKLAQFSTKTDAKKKRENLPALIRDAKRVGVRVFPPSVNKSDVHFKAMSPTKIRAGLGDISGVGITAARKVIKNRPYKASDFVPENEWVGPRGGARKDPARLGNSGVPSNVVMALCYAGAVPGVEIEDRWEAEKELLYCNISPHPNQEVLEEIREAVNDEHNIAACFPDGPSSSGKAHYAYAGGVIMRVHEHRYKAKKGENKGKTVTMAFLSIELEEHDFDVVCFPDVWAEVRGRAKEGNLALGRMEVKYDETRGWSLVATSLDTWE